jgi:hypothetical protein
MDIHHIEAAIKQAKKEGHRGVIGFTGSFDEHHKYSKLLNEGKLETFIQKYDISNIGFCSVLLMRKPKKLINQ